MIKAIFEYLLGWTQKKIEIQDTIDHEVGELDKKLEEFKDEITKKNSGFYETVSQQINQVIQDRDQTIDALEEKVENLHNYMTRGDQAVLSHIPYIEKLTHDHWDVVVTCYKGGCNGNYDDMIAILNHKSKLFEGEYGATEIARKITAAEEIRTYQQENGIDVLTYLLARVPKFKEYYSQYPTTGMRRNNGDNDA
jgi:hypothetical protein